GRGALEECLELGIVEIAERAAEEGEGERGMLGEAGERLVVGRGDSVDLESRVIGTERLRRALDDARADVDSDVGGEAAAAGPRVEQMSRLRGGPGAELDERARPDELVDLVRVEAEQVRFG